MFVKVARVQMSAKVEFSMPICIRYGSGVAIEMECTNNESKNESIDEADNGSNCSEEEDVPCPLLEFRVANLMNNVYGGEIIDAKMNVVAAIDATSHAPKILSSVFRPHRETIVVDSSAGPNPTSSLAMDDNQVFHEDACGYLVPKTSYIKLECQTHEHPFFKRVFLMRHKLDHNSPLLEPSIRDLVQSRNGAWPSELCNASAIRQSLRFNQLLVSLRGISNADARDVYAQKVYDFADVVVGYRFVNMMYRDQWGTLQTDMKLINDVVHQAGGGGENIFPGKSDLKRDVLFL